MAEVLVSCTIPASVDRAWAAVRDFNGLPAWHPFVASSRIEDDLPAATVGCIRNFQLKDGGGTIREQLLALSDVDRSCTYSILVAPMPVKNYVATLRLFPVTMSGQTFGHWSVRFEIPPDLEEETVAQVTGIFQEGFAGLQRMLTSEASGG